MSTVWRNGASHLPELGRASVPSPGHIPDYLCALLIVWKLHRSAVPVVRFWLELKLHGGDRGAAFKHCAGDPVHSVHDPAIDTEDDWIRGIGFLHEAHVLDHLSNGGHLHASAKPVVRIHVPKGIERDLSDRKFRTETDQLVDVPSIQALVARPEVILLAHRTQSAPRGVIGWLTTGKSDALSGMSAQSRGDTRPTLDPRLCVAQTAAHRSKRSRIYERHFQPSPLLLSVGDVNASCLLHCHPGVRRRITLLDEKPCGDE